MTFKVDLRGYTILVRWRPVWTLPTTDCLGLGVACLMGSVHAGLSTCWYTIHAELEYEPAVSRSIAIR